MLIDYADAHPDGKANVFVQWKGTDACFDFGCECGANGHFDGFFAYSLRCGACGAVYAMPSTVYPRRLTDDEVASWPSAGPVDVDMDDSSQATTADRLDGQEG